MAEYYCPNGQKCLGAKYCLAAEAGETAEHTARQLHMPQQQADNVGRQIQQALASRERLCTRENPHLPQP